MISAQRIKQPTTTSNQARFNKELIPVPCHQYFQTKIELKNWHQQQEVRMTNLD